MSSQLDLDDLRLHMITALFSDDELMNVLVLKGGNALVLVHKLSQRATIDIDFSMEDRFSEDFHPKERIEAALDKYLRKLGYKTIDLKFENKPGVTKIDTPPWWGGYLLKFKLIQLENESLPLDDQRRRAVVLGPDNKRTYKIDISHNEYCGGKQEVEINDITAYVYTLEMIVVEKLRALCQQMPEYEVLPNSRGRARDFYDIHMVLSVHDIDLISIKPIFEAIFKAKSVPLNLLWKIADHRSFHEESWAAVDMSAGVKITYDECFDFVCDLTKKLKTAWDM